MSSQRGTYYWNRTTPTMIDEHVDVVRDNATRVTRVTVRKLPDADQPLEGYDPSKAPVTGTIEIPTVYLDELFIHILLEVWDRKTPLNSRVDDSGDEGLIRYLRLSIEGHAKSYALMFIQAAFSVMREWARDTSDHTHGGHSAMAMVTSIERTVRNELANLPWSDAAYDSAASLDRHEDGEV